MSRLHRYAVALGSNRRSGLGSPAAAIGAALARLAQIGDVRIRSSIHATPALGPARRRFANAAAVVDTPLSPMALLGELKAIERAFGRRPGQRWGDRVIDLDIGLWSGGAVRQRILTVPHAQLSHRRFVLDPLDEIADNWRVGGLRVRHLRARLTRRLRRA